MLRGNPSDPDVDMVAPGTKPRPYDSPVRFGRRSADEWASACHHAFLIANVGVAKPGAFARNKKGRLKEPAQCRAAFEKWLIRLDRDSEEKPNFLPKKCSGLTEAFVRLWQSGKIAGHGEHILEFIAARIHATEVEVDAALQAAAAAALQAAAGAHDIGDDDDDDDQGLPEGAVDWCSCPHCPLPVYPGEGSECDFCWPVGTTCACQLGDGDDDE